MDQPEASLPGLRSIHHLKYVTFVLQMKNTAYEAMMGVCFRMYWRLKLIGMIAATVYVSSNCELSSNHARGGRLHGGPFRTSELPKSRGGRLHEDGHLLGTMP